MVKKVIMFLFLCSHLISAEKEEGKCLDEIVNILGSGHNTFDCEFSYELFIGQMNSNGVALFKGVQSDFDFPAESKMLEFLRNRQKYVKNPFSTHYEVKSFANGDFYLRNFIKIPTEMEKQYGKTGESETIKTKFGNTRMEYNQLRDILKVTTKAYSPGDLESFDFFLFPFRYGVPGIKERLLGKPELVKNVSFEKGVLNFVSADNEIVRLTMNEGIPCLQEMSSLGKVNEQPCFKRVFQFRENKEAVVPEYIFVLDGCREDFLAYQIYQISDFTKKKLDPELLTLKKPTKDTELYVDGRIE